MGTYAIVAASDFNVGHFTAHANRGLFDCVIAVDGGYAHLDAVSCAPAIAVGDFDSLGYVPDCVEILRYNPRKNASDLELALDAALERGASEIWVYGCLSGRLDHTVAALQQLARASEAGVSVTGVGGDFAVRLLTGPDGFSIPVPVGGDVSSFRGTVSVFAACDKARGVTERGLEYPLENADLCNRTSLGLSNELVGRPASVSLESGTVYVFYPL